MPVGNLLEACCKRKGGFEKFTLDDYTITRDGAVINNRWGGFRFVHRLVAEQYVPNPLNLPQVNHKDGDKTNNKADNLEWVTNLENRRHAVENGLHVHGEMCPWARLKQSDVDYVRAHPDITVTQLAQMFGVSRRAISDIRNGKTWKG